MAAKVAWYREAWWVSTRWDGNKKKDKRIGATKAHKRQVAEIAKEINVALAVGTFGSNQRESALPCDAELRHWHQTYSPTMKTSYRLSTRGLIENHLVPYYGSKDLRELREADLLAFVGRKLDQGLHPRTMSIGSSTALSGEAHDYATACQEAIEGTEPRLAPRLRPDGPRSLNGLGGSPRRPARRAETSSCSLSCLEGASTPQ